MIRQLFHFLFGKPPQIFDKDGSVRHDLPDKRWEEWKNRYTSGAEYNWRNHTGTKAKDRRPQQ